MSANEPSRKRPTLKDVADAVGVHVSTVSRALNPLTRHQITPEIAAKILKASASLNYRQNAAAYTLRTNRTRIVGVIIPDITNPVFPPIIRGVEDALAARGYMAIVVNTDGALPREASAIDMLATRGVDGVIAASVERDDPALLRLADDGTPVVTVNRRMDDPGIASIVNDEDGGMRAVLGHLAELGHSHIATIAGPQKLSTGKARLEAFLRHRDALGLAADDSLIVMADAFNETEGERWTQALLARNTDFTALVCSNDRLAVGAIAMLRRHGHAVPGDVSVTGFNDMPMVDRLEPALTTVRVQQYAAGRMAAEALLARIEQTGAWPPPRHEVLPVELIIRASTATPAVTRGLPMMADAMEVGENDADWASRGDKGEPQSEEADMKAKLIATAIAAVFLNGHLALAQDTLTVGFTVSQTGKLNNDSTAQMRGMELWRDQVNAAGGIKAGAKQYQVKFVSYDDESQPGRVQQLYTRLIAQDNAQFLFSPYSSGLVATASIISEQYGKVMLTTGAAEEKTYKLGNKTLFQLYSPAGQYLAGALKVLKTKNAASKIAFVYKDDPFSKAVMLATRALAVEQGLKVVLDESYSPETTDFGPIINKVISAGADALLGGGHYPDGATIARQLYNQKAPMKWVTLLVAPDSPNFATLGDAAIGISVPSQWEPQVSFKPDLGPTAAEFTKAFTQKYQIEPGYHAGGGYAAGLVLQHAIEQAGSIEPEKVASALNALDVTTMFGRTKFSIDPKEHGLQLGHDMVLAQWQQKDGKLVKEVVWPEQAKTADVLY